MAGLTNPKSELYRAQLRAEAAMFIARARQLETFQHKLVRGVARESPVRAYLANHLPTRIGIGTGAVVSSTTTPETQHDIVLFDRDFTAPILRDETASAFPIETVHGVIEVKSGPNLALASVTKSLAQLRQLNPLRGVRGDIGGTTDPAFHCVVAYRGPSPETAVQQLNSANTKNGAAGKRAPIDLVLVLSQNETYDISTGYLLGVEGQIDIGDGQKNLHYYPMHGEAASIRMQGDDVFARWMASLVNHLNGCRAFPPPLAAYFGFPYKLLGDDPAKG